MQTNETICNMPCYKSSTAVSHCRSLCHLCTDGRVSVCMHLTLSDLLLRLTLFCACLHHLVQQHASDSVMKLFNEQTMH